MKFKLYKIKCLTNLHVGNGDVNFNVIDCEVERDPVTNYPTINASGIKGAFREHFEAIGSNDITEIFGKGNAANNSNEKCGGKVKFFCANMLAIPMRISYGDKPYALVTTETAINQLKNLCVAICGREESITSDCSLPKIEIEGVPCSKSVNIFGEELYVMDDSAFSNIPLPVLARNCLEGKGNLWYEEIVPHESTFYFFAISADDTLDKFDEILKDNNIVQFGGNASIGYGMCKVEEV